MIQKPIFTHFGDKFLALTPPHHVQNEGKITDTEGQWGVGMTHTQGQVFEVPGSIPAQPFLFIPLLLPHERGNSP